MTRVKTFSFRPSASPSPCKSFPTARKADTQSSFAQTLHLTGLNTADLNTANAALQASLVSPDPKVRIDIANSLWIRDNAVQPDFLAMNQTYYGSEIGNVADAPEAVNAWVNRKTNGKIPTVLSGAKPDYANTVAIIVNAIYFKGAWTNKFDPAQTKDGTFTKADGSAMTAPFMTQTGDFDYYKGDHFQAVRLPYGAGRLSLIALLPDPKTRLDAFLARLTPENWDKWVKRLAYHPGTVALPRFKSEYSADLKPPLTALGLGIAFDQNNADLSGLAKLSPVERACIHSAVHKTFFEVNEEGAGPVRAPARHNCVRKRRSAAEN